MFACIAFLVYLDDVMCAVGKYRGLVILDWYFYLDDVMYAVGKYRGLVILDWYFGEGMETHRAGKRV